MTIKKGSFPKSTIRALMKEAGAKLVSKETLELMELLIKDYVRNITGRALVYMEHGKRKTLMPKDLELTQVGGA
jgi:histone H3/H4